jgi:hypothetical protein
VFEVILSGAALLISVATLGVTYRSWQLADRRSRLPVLVFLDSPGPRWRLKNVGNGPALNVVVAQKLRHDDTGWVEPTRVPALGRDEELPLTWLAGGGNVDVLAATYADLVGADGRGRGRTFTTLCAHNVNIVKPGTGIPAAVVTASEPDWRRTKQRQAEGLATP